MEKYGFNLQELRSKKEKLKSLLYSTDLTDDEAEDILNLITMYDSVLDNFVHSDDEIRDEMSKESLLSDFKDFVTYYDYNDEHIIVRNKLCLLL